MPPWPAYTFETFLLSSHTRTIACTLDKHPSLRGYLPALSHPHASPPHLPSPFPPWLPSPGRLQAAQPLWPAATAQTGGWPPTGRGRAGPGRVLPFPPLPQASSSAPAWWAQWGQVPLLLPLCRRAPWENLPSPRKPPDSGHQYPAPFPANTDCQRIRGQGDRPG